jgi:hypothetical protein
MVVSSTMVMSTPWSDSEPSELSPGENGREEFEVELEWDRLWWRRTLETGVEALDEGWDLECARRVHQMQGPGLGGEGEEGEVGTLVVCRRRQGPGSTLC